MTVHHKFKMASFANEYVVIRRTMININAKQLVSGRKLLFLVRVIRKILNYQLEVFERKGLISEAEVLSVSARFTGLINLRTQNLSASVSNHL